MEIEFQQWNVVQLANLTKESNFSWKVMHCAYCILPLHRSSKADAEKFSASTSDYAALRMELVNRTQDCPKCLHQKRPTPVPFQNRHQSFHQWNPPTPQHTDSHPCIRPRSWGTRTNLRDTDALLWTPIEIEIKLGSNNSRTEEDKNTKNHRLHCVTHRGGLDVTH